MNTNVFLLLLIIFFIYVVHREQKLPLFFLEF
jgi:hypothetical protein